MLIDTNLSREELFALVWERPATEVARELGISDVALGKLCRRLQVPKPPRGYWARVASGKKPRRPPLQEYRTEIEKRLRKQARSNTQIQLSKLQRVLKIMYLPTHFKETGANEIRHLIEEFPLSVLIVNTNDGLVANHIPLMFLNENVLIGQIARDNDLHSTFLRDEEVLAVFRRVVCEDAGSGE